MNASNNGSALLEPEETGPSGHLIRLRLSPREHMALHRVARSMQLSTKDCLRNLIMCATLDLPKPQPKKPKGERPPSAYRASLTTHLTKGQ